MIRNFPHYYQLGQKDCGPTCLRIIAKYYGSVISLQKVRELAETTRSGTSLAGLAGAAESLGFHTLGIKISLAVLVKDVPLPCILSWEKRHFVVLYKIKKNKFYLSDPAYGRMVYTKRDFLNGWMGANADEATKDGITLVIDPTPSFYEKTWEKEPKSFNFTFLLSYLRQYRKLIFQLGVGLLAGNLLQLIFPFLTQSIIDIGIQRQNIHFIYLVLIAQLMLSVGSAGTDIIRGWILLHLSARINISLLSDFFIKLMKLHISFFDTRMTGDIIERIKDHEKVESFLTDTSLSSLFSLFNLTVFGVVLAYYSTAIFLVFLTGSMLYMVWIWLFLERRKKLNYIHFASVSEEQSKTIELIDGMQEIKIHNAEQQKRWEWEFLQIKLFKIAVKNLKIQQFQRGGATFINELKNITITFLSAILVVRGELTLGMMLAVQYIVGQLNAPVIQLLEFIMSAQDAAISLERLGEVHNSKDEEDTEKDTLKDINFNDDIVIRNLSFRYLSDMESVLKNISLTIPAGKITAIVGMSGSGKTTLMKLLLKFYTTYEGEIKVGNTSLKLISQKKWRSSCGVVLQDGYIFNDTIAKNIALGVTGIDKKKLILAAQLSRSDQFIKNLPLGYNTKLGKSGVGLSGGEKQRILIARAIYKDPEFICFDEATASLDSDNEKVIMKNLDCFLRKRTAIIIAHRLSTVKNADQIVVLDKGRIVETGTHNELVRQKQTYYTLIKNQLDINR